MAQRRHCADGGTAQLQRSSPHLWRGCFRRANKCRCAIWRVRSCSFSPAQAQLAYAESLAAAEYLRSTYGMYALRRMLELLNEGEAPEAALRNPFKRITRSSSAASARIWPKTRAEPPNQP